MKEYEIKFSDIQRILIGEVPLHFYIEVILRVALIYVILMVSMRLMGKRMSTQLSRNEMAAVVSLAAAVGIPLMNPDRGLLPALVIAAVIIVYQIAIARKAAENKRFESLSQDEYSILVRDGVLDTAAMLQTRISRDRVLSQLRSEGIVHLGMVKRLYFEAGGSFSILQNPKPTPGLSVLPEWDKQFYQNWQVQTDLQVCENCGGLKPSVPENTTCINCRRKKWVSAVVQTK
jgi:uncharacterized membrane protein YcaP (DUF421 family)